VATRSALLGVTLQRLAPIGSKPACARRGTLRALEAGMLPKSGHRTEHSSPHLFNERILRRTEHTVRRVLAQGPGAIERRLRELDAEWDTERTLETMAASFGLLGVALGATVDRKWYALSGVVAGFLLQHAVQGWCPPLPLVRALGVRTMREIDAERFALKLARGDFRRQPYDQDEGVVDLALGPDSLQLVELQLVEEGTVASAASAS
jgi:hypothetical protein